MNHCVTDSGLEIMTLGLSLDLLANEDDPLFRNATSRIISHNLNIDIRSYIEVPGRVYRALPPLSTTLVDTVNSQ